MPPLDGTFALAEMHHVAVPVAQQSEFRCARPLDQLLDIQIGILERALGLARGVAKGGVQFGVRIHAPHALAAASGHRFQQQRIAMPCAKARASSTPRSVSSAPGTTGAPAAMAICRAASSIPCGEWIRRTGR
jgi:hypothetical protein